MTQQRAISIGSMVWIPVLITLAVTILRLAGELQGWTKLLFNTQPGGGGGLIGIVWLVPVFGVYFALKRARSSDRPRLGKAAGFALLGLLAIGGSIAVSLASKFTNFPMIILADAMAVLAMLIPLAGWRELTQTLLAYAYLARIPVALINFLSMRGSWGTHYEGTPPGFPADASFLAKYLLVGLMPQITTWIAFTVVIGSLFGIAAVAIFRRKSSAAAEATGQAAN